MSGPNPTATRFSELELAKKILVVDDFKAMRATMKKSLNALGFKNIDQAESGGEAIQFIKAKRFDLIVSDWNMPNVTGLEVLKHVKANPDYGHIHFMLVTAEADRYKIEQAIAEGVDEFLVKPFAPIKLREKFRSMLNRQPRKKVALKGSTVEEFDEDTQLIPAPIRSETREVLVVDDEPANLQLINELLKDKYKVRVANSGEKAIQIALANPDLDMVLLDIMMPEMDGYEVCRRLKENEATQSIPVIFLTAKTQTEDMTRAFELGAVDYITKPIDPPVLMARVKTHIDLKRSKDNLSDQIDSLMETMKLREEVERITRHDLKSPLSASLTTADQLLESSYLGVEQRESIELIRDATTEVIQMINRSLDLFKMERGTYQFHPESVDLVKLTQRVVSELRAPAKEKGVRILFEGPLLAFGLLEESLMRSTLGNLIKNAVEASKAKDEVKVSVLLHEALVEIQIKNPAMIPEPLQGSFFDKYSTAGKEGGTGIGTYSAKLMTEIQKGQIKFDSSEEAGTTLYLQIPIDPDAVQS